MHYKQLRDGDRVLPIMRGYKTCCCGCGLVHRYDFHIVRHGKVRYVEFTVHVDKRATAAARRVIKSRGKFYLPTVL